MRLIFCKFLLAAIFLNGLAAIAQADALDNWMANQVNTNSIASGVKAFSLGAIAYGNGRYVAVGSHNVSDFGIIETSGDGTN
jgi:hypothetical protein